MDTFLFDLKEIVKVVDNVTDNEKRFINYFTDKINIGTTDYDNIVVRDTTSVEFSFFLLTVIREYEKYR